MLTERQALLLPRIYDAAVAEDLWPRALDAVAEAADSKGAALLALDNIGLPFAIAKGSSWLNPADLKYYQENLICYEEEGWRYIKSKPVGTIIFDDEIWPNASELEERPDNHWMITRWGVLRRAAVRLNDSPGWMDSLTLQYCSSLKSIPQKTVRLAQALVPHIAKVVELHRTFAILRNRFHAVLNALDRIRVGVCITSAYGDVIVSNSEAERILGLADGLALGRDRRFLCADPDAAAAIPLAIHDAILTVSSKGNTHETLVAVKRRSGAYPFLMEVAPITDSVGELDKRLKGAIIFIVDPDNPRPFSVENVARAFDLTKAESLVCRHMVDGLTDFHIAERRSVSVETVRSQVKSIYRKTNTARRAELIRLTLSITPPIELSDKTN